MTVLATKLNEMAAAARNLVFDCAGLLPGSGALICYEAPELGWYDAGLAQAFAVEAAGHGIECRLLEVDAPEAVQTDTVARAIYDAANVIYFARIGDHDRFETTGQRQTGVMVYARTIEDFTSRFGRTPYAEMVARKKTVDKLISCADEIEISCPRGTLMRGSARLDRPLQDLQDTTIRRFPLGVPAPVPARNFNGKVALYGSLTPTGNSSYAPAVLPLDHQVMAVIESGKIVDFEGPQALVAKIRHHYQTVAETFGITPFFMHSWHAGIHPDGPFYDYDSANAEYWSNTVFCNPRVLHFHTCGNFAPGEISWNILDATVIADGLPLWKEGKWVGPDL